MLSFRTEVDEPEHHRVLWCLLDHAAFDKFVPRLVSWCIELASQLAELVERRDGIVCAGPQIGELQFILALRDGLRQWRSLQLQAGRDRGTRHASSFHSTQACRGNYAFTKKGMTLRPARICVLRPLTAKSVLWVVQACLLQGTPA